MEDHILLEEIQLLGAVIADVEGRATHLSPEEVDQVLEGAGTALRPDTPADARDPTNPTGQDRRLPLV